MTNTTETMTTLSANAEWLKDQSATALCKIIELVNNDGYPIDDVREFVEVHGAKALLDGHYETWAEFDDCYDQEAIEAVVEEFVINCIGNFEDAYCGKYDSGAEYARELVEGGWSHSMDNIPGFVEIDWEATWENLSQDYTEVDGYIFNNSF